MARGPTALALGWVGACSDLPFGFMGASERYADRSAMDSHPRMQELLVDRCQLVAELLVQGFDDFVVAAHETSAE